MSTHFILLTLLVGLGTWALRYVPTQLMRGTGNPRAPLSRFLAATGPAAISALCVSAVLPRLSPELAVLLPLVAGSAAVVALYYWRRDVTIATLGGAVCYGLVFAIV